MRRPVFLAVFFGLLLAVIPAAASVEGALRPEGASRVVAVVDGDTVTIDPAIQGANQVRLVGIQAPKLPLGRSGFEKWPLADEAKAHLETLVAGREVRLSSGGAEKDRHGRLLAHLFLADGVWVQERMLAAGMARVYSFSDNRAVVADLLAAEGRARAAGAGIWANAFYAVRDGADEAALMRDLGTFQVIEGRVRDAVRVKGTVYLNFGADWRSDFTAKIQARARRLFDRTGPDPVSLKGARVRVRGWLDRQNGPMIELTHPEQIEIVDAPRR